MQKEEIQPDNRPIKFNRKSNGKNGFIFNIESEKFTYDITTKPFKCIANIKKDSKNIDSSDNIMQEDDKFIYFAQEPKREKSKSFFKSAFEKITGNKDQRYIVMIDKENGSLFSGYIDKNGILDHDIEIFYKPNKQNGYDYAEKYFRSFGGTDKYKENITNEKRFGKNGRLYIYMIIYTLNIQILMIDIAKVLEY
jgi:hypothetical protein